MDPKGACKMLDITEATFGHLLTQFKMMSLNTESEIGRQDLASALETLMNLDPSKWPIGEEKKKSVPGAWLKRAEKFRDMAENLTEKIKHARRPMTQNPTPKRMRQQDWRLIEADRMERAQTAMVLLADMLERGTVPKVLQDVKTKGQIVDMVKRRTKDSGGGYHPRTFETDDYYDETPEAKALQDLIENKPQSAEEKAAQAAEEKARTIRRMEEDLRFTKIDGFFPTPKAVIDKMLAWANIEPGDDILEPSAGKGDICDAIRGQFKYTVHLTVCEVVPALQKILKAKGYGMYQAAKDHGGDFLIWAKWTPQRFNRILMNPPFEKGKDIDHVMRAFKLLKPGGRLVAIMCEGPFFRSDRKSNDFRRWLNQDVYDWETEALPHDAFSTVNAFRQTGVRTRILYIDKK